MVDTISIAGLSATDIVPGQYIELRFAQGPGGSGATEKAILLLGSKLASGSMDDGYSFYGADTEIQCVNESHVIALAGAGSELHRMWKRANAANPNVGIYILAVPEAAGAAAATGTVTLTGTATANATLRIRLDETVVDVSVLSGDTPTVMAANAVLDINSNPELAVVASSLAGVLTITSKNKGIRANDHFVSARFVSTSNVTVAPSVPTNLTGGTGADSVDRALTAMASKSFYYIVPSHSDATNLGKLSTYVNSRALPTDGNRQRLISAFKGNLAAGQTLTAGLNLPRGAMAFHPNSDWQTGELAAHLAANIALKEASYTAFSVSFNDYGADAVSQQFWSVPAPSRGGNLTRNEVKIALQSGLSPIVNTAGGKTKLSKLITTRYLNGSLEDFGIREWGKVSICDVFADALGAKYRAQLSQKLIGDDPAGNDAPPINTVTPRQVKALVTALVVEFAAAGLLQNPDVINAGVQVERSTTPSRINVFIPLTTATCLDQTATVVSEVSPA